MICAIYASDKQRQMYLYVEKRDDFSKVPALLLMHFGRPRFVMLFPLNGRKLLVNADIHQVKQALSSDGYYLQLPPLPENLLDQHLLAQGHQEPLT